LRTNYKEQKEDDSTPYKDVFGKSEFRDYTSSKKEDNQSQRKREASTGKSKDSYIESDPALDKIESRIKQIGDRLQ
jgi:hypothetical protein